MVRYGSDSFNIRYMRETELAVVLCLNVENTDLFVSFMSYKMYYCQIMLDLVLNSPLLLSTTRIKWPLSS